MHVPAATPGPLASSVRGHMCAGSMRAGRRLVVECSQRDEIRGRLLGGGSTY